MGSPEQDVKEDRCAGGARPWPDGRLYDHDLALLDGRNISLSDFSGKVVLLVNVATYRGFASQYPDMNALKETYDGDFEIIAVPSANFFNQEPSGDPVEIMNVIKWVRPGNDFQPNFVISARSDVNGASRLPVYSWALSRCEPPIHTLNNPQMLYYTPLSKEDIRWNFEKLLFDRNKGSNLSAEFPLCFLCIRRFIEQIS